MDSILTGFNNSQIPEFAQAQNIKYQQSPTADISNPENPSPTTKPYTKPASAQMRSRREMSGRQALHSLIFWGGCGGRIFRIGNSSGWRLPGFYVLNLSKLRSF